MADQLQQGSEGSSLASSVPAGPDLFGHRERARLPQRAQGINMRQMNDERRIHILKTRPSTAGDISLSVPVQADSAGVGRGSRGGGRGSGAPTSTPSSSSSSPHRSRNSPTLPSRPSSSPYTPHRSSRSVPAMILEAETEAEAGVEALRLDASFSRTRANARLGLSEREQSALKLGNLIMSVVLEKPEVGTSDQLSRFFFDAWLAKSNSSVAEADTLSINLLSRLQNEIAKISTKHDAEAESKSEPDDTNLRKKEVAAVALSMLDRVLEEFGRSHPILFDIKQNLLPVLFQDLPLDEEEGREETKYALRKTWCEEAERLQIILHHSNQERDTAIDVIREQESTLRDMSAEIQNLLFLKTRNLKLETSLQTAKEKIDKSEEGKSQLAALLEAQQADVQNMDNVKAELLSQLSLRDEKIYSLEMTVSQMERDKLPDIREDLKLALAEREMAQDQIRKSTQLLQSYQDADELRRQKLNALRTNFLDEAAYGTSVSDTTGSLRAIADDMNRFLSERNHADLVMVLEHQVRTQLSQLEVNNVTVRDLRLEVQAEQQKIVDLKIGFAEQLRVLNAESENKLNSQRRVLEEKREADLSNLRLVFEEEKAVLNQTIDRLHTDVADRQRELDEARIQIGEIKARLEDTLTQLRDTSAKLASSQELVASKDAELVLAHVKLNEAQLNLELSRKETEHCRTDLLQLANEHGMLQQDTMWKEALALVRLRLHSAEASVLAAQSKILILEAEVATLCQEVAATREEAESLKQDLSVMKIEAATAQAAFAESVAESERCIALLEQQIARHLITIARLEAETLKEKARVQVEKDELNLQLRSKIDESERNAMIIEDQCVRIDLLDATLAEISTQKAQLEAELKDRKNEMAIMATDYAQSISTFHEELLDKAELDADVAPSPKEFVDIKSEEVLDEKEAVLRNRVEEQSDMIDSLQGKIESLEASLKEWAAHASEQAAARNASIDASTETDAEESPTPAPEQPATDFSLLATKSTNNAKRMVQPFLKVIRRNENSISKEASQLAIALSEAKGLIERMDLALSRLQTEELDYYRRNTPGAGNADDPTNSRSLELVWTTVRNVRAEVAANLRWLFDLNSYMAQRKVAAFSEARAAGVYDDIASDLKEDMASATEDLAAYLRDRSAAEGGWRSALVQSDGSYNFDMPLHLWLDTEKIEILQEQIKNIKNSHDNDILALNAQITALKAGRAKVDKECDELKDELMRLKKEFGEESLDRDYAIYLKIKNGVLDGSLSSLNEVILNPGDFEELEFGVIRCVNSMLLLASADESASSVKNSVFSSSAENEARLDEREVSEFYAGVAQTLKSLPQAVTTPSSSRRRGPASSTAQSVVSSQPASTTLPSPLTPLGKLRTAGKPLADWKTLQKQERQSKALEAMRKSTDHVQRKAPAEAPTNSSLFDAPAIAAPPVPSPSPSRTRVDVVNFKWSSERTVYLVGRLKEAYAKMQARILYGDATKLGLGSSQIGLGGESLFDESASRGGCYDAIFSDIVAANSKNETSADAFARKLNAKIIKHMHSTRELEATLAAMNPSMNSMEVLRVQERYASQQRVLTPIAATGALSVRSASVPAQLLAADDASSVSSPNRHETSLDDYSYGEFAPQPELACQPSDNSQVASVSKLSEEPCLLPPIVVTR